MSQIHNVNVSQVQFQQDQLNTRAVEQPRSSRLGEVAQNIEAGDPQPRRVHRSAASIVGRVFLGIVTAGISEAVIAIVNKIRGSHAQAPATVAKAREQNLEQAPDEMNGPRLSDAMQDNALPPDYQAAMKEALAELKEAMGDYLKGNPTTAAEMHNSEEFMNRLSNDIYGISTGLSPDQFRDKVFEAGMGRIKFEAIEEIAKAKGAQVLDFYRHIPEFGAKLDAARNAAELNALFNASEVQFDQCVEHVTMLGAARTEAQNSLTERFRERFGVSADVLRKTSFWKEARSQFDKAGKNLPLGSTDTQIKDAFNKVADSMLASMSEAFDSIDKLDCSDALKDRMKNFCFVFKDFPQTIELYIGGARAMADSVNAFVELAKTGDIDELALKLYTMIVDDAVKYVDGQKKMTGREDTLRAGVMGLAFALEMYPELGKIFREKPDMMKQIHAKLEGDDLLNVIEARGGDASSKTFAGTCLLGVISPHLELQDDLVRGSCMKDAFPLHTQAMKDAETAVRDAVGVDLPDNMMAIKLPSGKTVAKAIAEAVGSEKGALSADALRSIAVKVMCGCQEVRDAAIAKFGPDFEPDFVAKHAG